VQNKKKKLVGRTCEFLKTGDPDLDNNRSSVSHAMVSGNAIQGSDSRVFSCIHHLMSEVIVYIHVVPRLLLPLALPLCFVLRLSSLCFFRLYSRLSPLALVPCRSLLLPVVLVHALRFVLSSVLALALPVVVSPCCPLELHMELTVVFALVLALVLLVEPSSNPLAIPAAC
jgi:hypothetical protein